MQLQNNLLDYAEGVVRAVSNYIGVPYSNGTPTTEGTYTVKKGDSLYSIANKYNISVDELKNANNITGNLLQIGQVLTIPNKEEITPGDYEVYTVKKDDNLWNIAKQYGVSVNDLVSLNNLGTTMLQVGQQLLIPKQQEENNNNDNITYIVQSGDSLWNIAKKYNITVNELKEANNLTSNLLQIGQKLTIPSESDYLYYTVKSGDSLWKIAKEFNVNINDLISVNNLNSDVLSIGQVLLIPNKK